uniref:Uncharacterized protein LOC111125722 n=1 Tax=Crassostrea virginica TaxID=6565 RepID=A0A8B8DD84_CRAVI|nr:uncharacterized protein LOC111125722 [Crassostrea virginica]
MEGSKFLLVGLVLTICAFIFQLIGLVSPYWTTFEYGGVTEVYLGLWKYCVKTKQNDVSTCTDSTDNITEGWFTAVQAMSILGLIALVAALVMTILKMFVMKENKVPQFVAIATAFAAAIFILISIAVYAAEMNEKLKLITFNNHFAFAFCIIAMLAAIGAGCLVLVDAMK